MHEMECTILQATPPIVERLKSGLPLVFLTFKYLNRYINSFRAVRDYATDQCTCRFNSRDLVLAVTDAGIESHENIQKNLLAIENHVSVKTTKSRTLC